MAINQWEGWSHETYSAVSRIIFCFTLGDWINLTVNWVKKLPMDGRRWGRQWFNHRHPQLHFCADERHRSFVSTHRPANPIAHHSINSLSFTVNELPSITQHKNKFHNSQNLSFKSYWFSSLLGGDSNINN